MQQIQQLAAQMTTHEHAWILEIRNIVTLI